MCTSRVESLSACRRSRNARSHSSHPKIASESPLALCSPSLPSTLVSPLGTPSVHSERVALEPAASPPPSPPRSLSSNGKFSLEATPERRPANCVSKLSTDTCWEPCTPQELIRRVDHRIAHRSAYLRAPRRVHELASRRNRLQMGVVFKNVLRMRGQQVRNELMPLPIKWKAEMDGFDAQL